MQDNSGWTPLHIAGVNDFTSSGGIDDKVYVVSAGHEDIVRELLGAGAEINKTNDKGLTPLSVCKY